MRDSSSWLLRVRSVVPVAAGLVLVAATAFSARGSQAAPDPPAKPYSVFLSYAGEVDAELDARLRNAVGALETALAEYPDWFRLTDSRDEANIRVTLFDAQAATGELRHVGGPAGFIANRVFESRGRDFFSFRGCCSGGRKSETDQRFRHRRDRSGQFPGCCGRLHAASSSSSLKKATPGPRAEPCLSASSVSGHEPRLSRSSLLRRL